MGAGLLAMALEIFRRRNEIILKRRVVTLSKIDTVFFFKRVLIASGTFLVDIEMSAPNFLLLLTPAPPTETYFYFYPYGLVHSLEMTTLIMIGGGKILRPADRASPSNQAAILV